MNKKLIGPYSNKDFDENDPTYLEVMEYFEQIYKPALGRVVDKIMDLYNTTIVSGACVLSHVNHGPRKFITVTDEFINNHLYKFVEYRKIIEEYDTILRKKIREIRDSHCKYGDATCYLNRPDCDCSYYIITSANMLSITHATRKKFVSIKLEIEGECMFYFAFLVGNKFRFAR